MLLYIFSVLLACFLSKCFLYTYTYMYIYVYMFTHSAMCITYRLQTPCVSRRIPSSRASKLRQDKYMKRTKLLEKLRDGKLPFFGTYIDH